MRSISRETPLAEITLRRYEKPYNLRGRELTRKVLLSIGLLQPGDSRDIIVDIFHVMLGRKPMTVSEIEKAVIDFRKKQRLPLLGIASSNIRRQLKRLKEIFLVEKRGSSYRITENSKIIDIFEEKIELFLVPSIMKRVKEYFKAVK